MILWVALLMGPGCLCLTGAAAESSGLERIAKCGNSCSQGLHCRSKPNYFFNPSCQTADEGLNASSVFRNGSFSTVMSCDRRQKCSLRLRISTALQLSNAVHGLSICTITAGMMVNCQILSFSRSSRERMAGQQVEVSNDCTSVSPDQQVQVMVKTVPSFCGVMWTGTYEAPGCSSEDLRRNVPECITGRLSYVIHSGRKELSVGVSEMLEDHDYHLRLCYKDFICLGTGANALIKKEQAVKSVDLPYSRPLPCLCIEVQFLYTPPNPPIWALAMTPHYNTRRRDFSADTHPLNTPQGWSAVTDALRVQVCPFTERLEELWFGVTFDPLEESLSWELACPVHVGVALCQSAEDGQDCVDLPHTSQNVSRGKVTFTDVDPQPQLCMKFTVGSQSWTRCPFADGSIKAWDVAVSTRRGHEGLELTSKVNATFSVGLCGKPAGPAVCRVAETHTVHVERNIGLRLNLSAPLCDSCVQVKRVDVKHAATVLRCLERCDHLSPLPTTFSPRPSWALTSCLVPAGVCLSVAVLLTLAMHVQLRARRRRKQNVNGNEKPTDPAMQRALPVPRDHPHAGIVAQDFDKHGSTEKSNLLSQ